MTYLPTDSTTTPYQSGEKDSFPPTYCTLDVDVDVRVKNNTLPHHQPGRPDCILYTMNVIVHTRLIYDYQAKAYMFVRDIIKRHRTNLS